MKYDKPTKREKYKKKWSLLKKVLDLGNNGKKEYDFEQVYSQQPNLSVLENHHDHRNHLLSLEDCLCMHRMSY